MNKAFTKESDHEDDEEQDEPSPLPVGTKNYMTPAGFLRLRTEALHLLDKERPELTKVIQWAASIDAAERHRPSGPVAATKAAMSCSRTCPWAGAGVKSNGPSSVPSVPMTDTSRPLSSIRSGRRYPAAGITARAIRVHRRY